MHVMFVLQDRDAMAATRVALTVKDFNYYIGHAYVSLSHLHVNMLAAPPRTIRLTATHRTEMRRMVTRVRRDPSPRSEAPSGYIVDISRDDDAREGRTTRAIVNRSGGGGGAGRGGRDRGGAEGVGPGGSGQESRAARSSAPRPPPVGTESLFPFGLGLGVSSTKTKIHLL